MPVSLEPTAPRSQVKHSAIEPLRFHFFFNCTDLPGEAIGPDGPKET